MVNSSDEPSLTSYTHKDYKAEKQDNDWCVRSRASETQCAGESVTGSARPHLPVPSSLLCPAPRDGSELSCSDRLFCVSSLLTSVGSVNKPVKHVTSCNHNTSGESL